MLIFRTSWRISQNLRISYFKMHSTLRKLWTIGCNFHILLCYLYLLTFWAIIFVSLNLMTVPTVWILMYFVTQLLQVLSKKNDQSEPWGSGASYKIFFCAWKTEQILKFFLGKVDSCNLNGSLNQLAAVLFCELPGWFSKNWNTRAIS